MRSMPAASRHEPDAAATSSTRPRERGYLHQCTDAAALDAAAAGGRVAGYIGFDCTADSLHVGSLVQIMLLRLLQQPGHRPVVLMGGGTTKVGRPVRPRRGPADC